MYFSKNKKLNNVLNEIADDLLNMCDTRKESITEIKRYMTDFPNKADYNLYSYGNLLIYYSDILDLYKEYKTIKRFSMEKLIQTYERQVGYVARWLVQAYGQKSNKR